MNPAITDVLLEAVKLLFTAGVPLALAGLAGGIIAGFLQSVTSIHDAAIGYSARLLSLVIGLYLTLPLLEHGFADLWTLVGSVTR